MNKDRERSRCVFWKRCAGIAAVLLLTVLWIFFDRWIQPFAPTPRAVEIPDFCGMQEGVLKTEAWMLVRTEYRYDATVPEGTVIAQTPAAGSRRKLTEQDAVCEIKLVVSLGAESIVLPTLVGHDVREVIPLLRAQGLVVKTVMQTSAYTVGRILSSEPRGGETVQRGGTVVLTVSAGESAQPVTVPDLKGLSRSDALIRLWLCQLNAGEVVEVISDAPAGSVVKQSHQPGTVVMAGTKINLFISAQNQP